MQPSRRQRAEFRAQPESQRDRAENAADAAATKEHGDQRDNDRAARPLHQPKEQHEPVDQQQRRKNTDENEAGRADD